MQKTHKKQIYYVKTDKQLDSSSYWQTSSDPWMIISSVSLVQPLRCADRLPYTIKASPQAGMYQGGLAIPTNQSLETEKNAKSLNYHMLKEFNMAYIWTQNSDITMP